MSIFCGTLWYFVLTYRSHVYVEADASINTYGEEENRRSTLNLVQRDIRKVGSGRRPGSAEATEESA